MTSWVGLRAARFGAYVEAAPTEADTEPPTQPTNFTATPVTSSRIDLSWGAASDNIGVAGYEVGHKVQGGVETVVGVGNVLGWAHQGLAASTPYEHRSRAYDGAGNRGPWTATLATTTSAVEASYDADVLALSPVGYWQLDESTGLVIADSAGAVPGSLSAGVEYVAAPLAQQDAGGRCLGFAGGAHGLIPYNDAHTAASGSLCLLVQVDALAGKMILASRQGGSLVAGSMAVEVLADGTLRAWRGRAAGAFDEVKGGAGQVEVGAAYFIALTWGSAGLKLYLYGMGGNSAPGQEPLAAAARDWAAITPTDTGDLNLAQWPSGSSALNGLLAHVAVFNRQLSDAEVARIALPLTVARGADTTPPSQVELVRVTSITTSINLVWEAATDDNAVVRYDIYRDATGGLTTLYGSATTESFEDTAWVAGGTYRYQVLAVDAAGNEGLLSDMLTVGPATANDDVAPTAVAGGNAIEVDVLANDEWAGEPVVTITNTAGLLGGDSAAVGGDEPYPTIIYTPPATASGPWSLTYSLDADLNTGPATATVTGTVQAASPTSGSWTVASGTDDAEERIDTGAVTTTSFDLDLQYDVQSAAHQIVGIRFRPTIPLGAQLQTAAVQFTVKVAGSTALTLTIRAEASHAAAPFQAAVNDISNRPLTAASATWSLANWPTADVSGPDQRTVDLSAVIQEVLDLPGRPATFDLVLVFTGSTANVNRRVAYSFDGDSASAPVLDATWV